jgi:hypothetical protein
MIKKRLSQVCREADRPGTTSEFEMIYAAADAA